MMLDDDSLYALLPAYHRERDAALGHPLRAFFRVLSRDGAQPVEADIDAWHDALFVETCAEALLPRLAALVGAEPQRPAPAGAEVSMRAFIGNVLRYRRAKGTARTLELLARDVTGFTARAVEFYPRLATTLSVRAPRPDRPATPLLRDAEVRALHGGPFDRNPRVPDVRSIRRAGGRYNLPNVGVFVWRLDAQPYDAPRKGGTQRFAPEELDAVPPALPWDAFPGHFALAPGGRVLPLFAPARGAEGATPAIHDTPDRLRRLALWRELEARRAAVAAGRTPARGWFADTEPFALYVRREHETSFARLAPEEIAVGNLEAGATVPPWDRTLVTARNYPRGDGTVAAMPITVVVDPATGRLVFAPAAAGQDVADVRVAYATGMPGEVGGGAYERGAPQPVPAGALVYVVRAGPAPNAQRVDTLADALARWESFGAGRHGCIVVADNGADGPAGGSLDFAMPRDSQLTVVAGEWRPAAAGHPEVLGFVVPRSRRALLLRPLHVDAAATTEGQAGRLTLDGLRCEAGVVVAPRALAALSVRHATLAPLDGLGLDAAGHVAEPLAVAIERSVCGAVRCGPDVARVQVRESVLARVTGRASLDAGGADVVLERATLLGALASRTLEASDCILLGAVTVTRTQVGCVRYSFVDPATAKVPRRFRCQPDLAVDARAAALGRPLQPDEAAAQALRVRPVFIDDDPGEPAFAMLRMDAPREITMGGEGDTEMGAYGFAAHALRLANLDDLFVDYLPLGLEAAAIGADRANHEALRSQLP